MPPVLYKCPTTGQNVQWSVEETTSEPSRPVSYQGIQCPACTRLHFINPATGKLLGQE